MDTPQVIAPPCAQPGSPGTQDVTPTSGVIHVNTRHVSGFVIIGNHLAQHHELSLIAIGLAVHIQSLPAGAKVGIKVLTNRFPESEARITAALHELEAEGYLHRSRVRLATGRVVTRTISYNKPGATAPPVTTPQRKPQRPTRPAPEPLPEPTPAPTTAPSPAPELAAPIRVPAPTAPRKQPAPLPQPHAPTAQLTQAAAALLADLRRHAPQLTLTEEDIPTLAPGIAAWLERDVHPDTIRHALTDQLPHPVKHPAKFVRNRITTLLPPPLPGTTDLTPPPRRTPLTIPLQNCDTCDRAFRATHPGHCRDCRSDLRAEPTDLTCGAA
ncbi:helix-turn-helix domain-containing protein [Streptomyces sp. NBC_00385]|uniref:helix-turn-helix domain-containing protein n=1 Tax=Streptomyces sp. NBC_00385 TaxID=2975733 RepID=UPI002DDA09A0|nr:helix-turn-helix domain-containing protein [Streptomyces sp. NBC_00385]WRZ05790.1 helix-turn-helix domain-containing protein [Streptomyces sp. NBC_00385]